MDSAWYETDKTLGILRWGKDCSPPSHATVALILEKPLSSADVTARWKKLSILMPLITSLIAFFLGGLNYKGSQPPQVPPNLMEKYSVEGMINLDGPDGNPIPYEKIQLSIRPPNFHVLSDGSFQLGDFPVCLNKEKKLINPPRLLIDSGQKGYIDVVAHLYNKGEKIPIGVTDFKVKIDPDTKLIKLHKMVDFKLVPSQKYDPTTQQTPTPVKFNESSG